MKSMQGIDFMIGRCKKTSPEGSVHNPLLLIFKIAPSTPNFDRKGNMISLTISTEGSSSLLVTPLRVILKGPFPNMHTGIIVSR